jgi:hypothetical protein
MGRSLMSEACTLIIDLVGCHVAEEVESPRVARVAFLVEVMDPACILLENFEAPGLLGGLAIHVVHNAPTLVQSPQRLLRGEVLLPSSPYSMRPLLAATIMSIAAAASTTAGDDLPIAASSLVGRCYSAVYQIIHHELTTLMLCEQNTT